MVMLHIKLNGITKYSNMEAIILPADSPHLTLGSKGKHLFFQTMVMLQIKLMES